MVLGTTKKAQKQNKLAKLPSIEEETERLKNIPKAIAPNEAKTQTDVSTGEQITRQEAMKRVEERALNPELREQATINTEARKVQDQVKRLTLQQQLDQKVREAIAAKNNIPLDKTIIPQDVNALRPADPTQKLDNPISEGIRQGFNQASGLTGEEALTGNVLDNVAVFTKPFINIADNIRALTRIGGKDTARVQDAQSAFNNINKEIDILTENVMRGRLDSADVEVQIVEALRQNAILERTAKEKGLGNLKYWLAGGKDLETQASLNEATLNEKLRILRDAQIQGNNARTLALANEQIINDGNE